MTLEKLQENFCDYILSENNASIPAYLNDAISCGKISKASALNVYRNNYQHNILQNLSIIFPTVKKIVGDTFFAHIAINYAVAYPPKTGILLEYGGGLSEFIGQLPEVDHLLYLPDTALLDWFLHLAHHAPANTNRMNNVYSAILERQLFDNCYLKIAKNVQLMHSAYAVDLIYNFCNNEGLETTETLDYTRRDANLIIFKVANQTTVKNVSDIAFKFLQLTATPKSFAEILEILLESYNEQLTINNLQELFNLPIFSGFGYEL